MKKIIVFILFYNYTFGQNSDDILGIWLNQDNDAKIEIYTVYSPHNKEKNYHGKLIWLKEAFEEDGSAKVDDENPKESLRSRKLQNLVIIKNLEFDGSEWSGGTIYDPKSGKTYKCYAKINGDNLNLRGYIGFSFIGRTATWKKVK